MISTVTTSTVSTVTTSAIAGTVALIGVLLLFGLIIQKEIATDTDNQSLKKLGKILNIGIIPLVIAVLLLLIYRVMDVLR